MEFTIESKIIGKVEKSYEKYNQKNMHRSILAQQKSTLYRQDAFSIKFYQS